MTPWVQRLIIANVIVFLLQKTVPGMTEQLQFVPALVLYRPWTLLTYMFAHSPFSISHILFNMFALYFFGPRVEERLGGKRFIRMYLISGIAGGLLSLVTPFAAIVGASGAVFGVQLAFARYWPRDRILIWGIIPVEARVLVAITTVMALYGGFTGGGGIAHFAHLGGFLGAWLYLKWAEAHAPVKQWQKKVEGPAATMVPIGNWRLVDLAKVHEVNRDEVSRILDKLSTGGERSLTTAERTFLQHFVPKD